jgi:anaerobic selenocysteine-containing dehydrogenase
MCGLKIETREQRVTSIKGDPQDPLSRGHICPKATALKDLQEDPDRLRQPIRRIGDTWQEISWDEAYDLVVDKLLEVREKHGPNAVGVYAGNPNVHNYANFTHGFFFLKMLKTRNRFSATSVDQLPHQLIAHWMYGHQLLVPIPDLDATDHLLMLGANPIASNGSLMSAPDVRKRLLAIKERGKLVVIDPRRTETARLADEFHFIKPGTDAALLAAMVNVIFEEDLADPGHLAPHLTGLSEVREALQTYTPERAATVTGINADTIRQLARDMARAKRAVCYGRMGLSTQQFGSLCQWLTQIINITTGNLDREGGALFTKPAIDQIGGAGSKPGHLGAWKSRVRGLPEFSGELPSAALADELLTPGEDQIKAMVTVAGNPVLSTPNGRRLEQGLAKLDFMVSVDIYLNETTRFADVILPPTAPLEHDHYDLVFHVLAIRNTTKYSPAVFERPPEARHDHEIFVELGKRMGQRLGLELNPIMRMLPEQVLDMGLKAGPYGAQQGHELALDINKLKQHPHGIDLGPLQSSIPERLYHADKKIKCDPPLLMEDLQRMERVLFGEHRDGLLLIGRRHLRSNNSWMHNCKALVKGKGRCDLMMHPDDMAGRDIANGDLVRVSSRVGQLDVRVAASEDIAPGVVSLPHGWGHGRKGSKMAVAAAHPGVSINDITDETLLDELSGNAAVNGVPVRVSSL